MRDRRLYEWMALRRVAGGGMAKVAGVYLDHGRPVPEQLTSCLTGSCGADWSRLPMAIRSGSCGGSG